MQTVAYAHILFVIFTVRHREVELAEEVTGFKTLNLISEDDRLQPVQVLPSIVDTIVL